jgi:superfamily II DNA or RNA helicase
MVMQEHLGSVIHRSSRLELEGLGQIIPCEYFSMGFGLDGDHKESSAYDIAYDDWMTENPTFHKLIAALCRRYQGDGTLILVDKIALGKHLEAIINKSGLTAHFIYGKTPKRRRDEVLRAFERREFDVLIGGKIINRGLDLAGGCENLIIATGGKLESDFVQKIGRAVRRNKMGRSRVFDFYFRCNKYLYDHSKARLRAMVNAGYRSTVVFPGGSINGEQLIRRRYVIPKRLFRRAKERQRELFATDESAASSVLHK